MINKCMRSVFDRYLRLERKWNRMVAFYHTSISGGSLALGVGASINVPVRADGAGRVTVGDQVSLGYKPAFRLGSGEILLQARNKGACIQIGTSSRLSNNVCIIAMESIKIGQSCQIGDLVMILDSDFHEVSPTTRNATSGEISPVEVGNNVWIGSRSIVLKGTKIGANSVIAAGSVVTKSIPENVIAAGIPAKIIRDISDL